MLDFNKVHKINQGQISNCVVNEPESMRPSEMSLDKKSLAMSNRLDNFDDFDLEESKASIQIKEENLDFDIAEDKESDLPPISKRSQLITDRTL